MRGNTVKKNTAKKTNVKRKPVKKKKRKKIILKKRFFVILLLILCVIAYSVYSHEKHKQKIIQEAVVKADAAAAQYDYKKAISIMKGLEYKDDKKVQAKLEKYRDQKSRLKQVSPDSVTHVFFHSLVVDPIRGFSLTGKSAWDSGTPGFCQWMTTVKEFNAILDEMYDKGYVLIDLKDLCDEEMNPGKIYLPKGKKAFVLSLDDLSYYHSYDDRGTASKIVLNKENKPVCEYYTKDGTKKTGAYDAVPLLDKFIEEHPDFSYRGAKGTIALTGYDGVLGYRTDTAYRDETNLDNDQKEWLQKNPNFDWEKECKEAKKVADAIKKDGWRFASHTWGHIKAGQTSLDGLKRDTEKWKNRVEPIVGETDIIIFAHGEDIALPDQYASSEKFKYLSSEGYRYFCNVDGRVHTTVMRDTYFHQGRRNLDGYRMYQAKYKDSDMLSDLFDVNEVWDKDRPSDDKLYDLGGTSSNQNSSGTNSGTNSNTSTSTNTSTDTSNQSSNTKQSTAADKETTDSSSKSSSTSSSQTSSSSGNKTEESSKTSSDN